MQVVIIAKIDKDVNSHIGVWKKLQGMVRAYVDKGHDVSLLHLQGGHAAINGSLRKGKFYQIPDMKADEIWIRHFIFGFGFLRSITQYKSAYPDVSIYYDFPTYPYIHEFTGWKRVVTTLHASWLMPKLSKVITTFTGVNTLPSLNDRPYLRMSNKIHIDDYHLIPTIKDSTQSTIHLLAVGVLWDWYGLDRVIASMQAYKGNYAIKLHIMGKGPEEEALSYQMNSMPVKHQVIFYGWSDINDFPTKFDTNVIAVGTLAANRKNLEEVLSLKHREYAACGLPFFYAGRDPDFAEVNWVYNIKEQDDCVIDLNDLFEWYFRSNINGEQIRTWSKEHLSWTI